MALSRDHTPETIRILPLSPPDASASQGVKRFWNVRSRRRRMLYARRRAASAVELAGQRARVAGLTQRPAAGILEYGFVDLKGDDLMRGLGGAVLLCCISVLVAVVVVRSVTQPSVVKGAEPPKTKLEVFNDIAQNTFNMADRSYLRWCDAQETKKKRVWLKPMANEWSARCKAWRTVEEEARRLIRAELALERKRLKLPLVRN